jgi:sulfur carrier protein ThiS
MPKPMIRIHDVETNEVIDREMTAAELKVHEADLARFNAKLEAEAEEQATKADLLERLGITADEAKLLLS